MSDQASKERKVDVAVLTAKDSNEAKRGVEDVGDQEPGPHTHGAEGVI